MRGGNTDNVYLTNVYFDRHIYQPLIAKKLRDSSKYSIHPNGLNSGEVQFIEDLKTYLDSNPEVFKDTKLFVLRNLPKLGVKFSTQSASFRTS